MSATERRRQPKGLARYQARERRERRREAERKVRAWERWLKAGSDLRKVPQIPSDAEFKLVRGRR